MVPFIFHFDTCQVCDCGKFSWISNKKGYNHTKGKVDTSSKVEDKVIDEVIAAKKPIKKDKVLYLTQVTKYGFKDLFKNYSYNSSIPYSSQVNPHAESYMESYLKANQDYLLKLKKRECLILIL